MSTPIAIVYPAPTNPTTRITRLFRRRMIQTVWMIVTIFSIGIFAAGTSIYADSLRYGCLCDHTYIDIRDNRLILLPIPDGPLAGIAQDGDIVEAVDGEPVPVGITIPQAVAIVDAGEAGTEVTLSLRTGDAAPRDITFKRSGSPVISLWLRLGLSLNAAIVFAVLVDTVSFGGFTGLALLMARKRSDDWLVLYASCCLISYGVLTSAAYGSFSYLHASGLWAVLSALITTAAYNLMIMLPDGHFKPRWTIVLVFIFTIWSFITTIQLIAVEGIVANLVNSIFVLLLLIITTYRYRRFFTSIQRQQTKWIIFGVGVAVLFNQLYLLILEILWQRDYVLWRLVQEIGYPGTRIVFLFIPLGFAFAMLRHRLWEIDLTVNRSLVYGAVSLILGGLFIIAFLIAQRILDGLLGMEQSTAAAAISAAVTAVCFNPTRKRVRALIDRRLYGFRFDLNELKQAQQPLKIANPGALTGKKLGSYEVLGVLGKGGMGEVYQGTNGSQFAAIKILPPDLARQPDFVKRFEREAKTLASFSHPNIVKIYEAGECDGIYFMAMELIDGRELGSIIREQGKIPYHEIKPLVHDFASGLDYAHQNGFVHRDIKPSNIMIVEGSKAILMDFGIAKFQNVASSLTGTGAIGTIDYMAPEQIMAAREVDHRADIYAMGAVLYEMLTGECPFKGSAGQVLFAHLQQPAPDPRDVEPDIPPEIARAIQKAMAKNPEDRFQSAGDFAIVLNNYA